MHTTVNERAIGTIVRKLAGDRAERFQNEVLLPALARLSGAQAATREAVLDACEDSLAVLRVFLGHYAFARRGEVGTTYAQIALEALANSFRSSEELVNAVGGPEPPSIWPAMLQECERRKRKPNEQLNRNILDGLMKLVHRIYAEDQVGNLFHWIRDSVLKSEQVHQVFDALVEVRGIGPKIAALVLRDLAWLYKLEQHIVPVDRLLLQPVDTWTRRVADLLSEEVSSDTTPDWVIAGKLSKLARRQGVSGVALNMGIQYFGAYEVRVTHYLSRALAALAQSDSERGYATGTG